MNKEFMRMAKDASYRRLMANQDIKKGDVVYHYRNPEKLAIVVDVNFYRYKDMGCVGTHKIKWAERKIIDEWVPLYCYRVKAKRSFTFSYIKAFLKYVLEGLS